MTNSNTRHAKDHMSAGVEYLAPKTTCRHTQVSTQESACSVNGQESRERDSYTLQEVHVWQQVCVINFTP